MNASIRCLVLQEGSGGGGGLDGALLLALFARDTINPEYGEQI